MVVNKISVLCVIVKALQRVCTKIQHEGACKEANAARGEAKCDCLP